MKPMNDSETAIRIMKELRDDGWCVVLKCLPKEMGWIIEGSRSEYDAPSPDQEIGKGKWLCELHDMAYVRKGTRYRKSRDGLGDTPLQAVREAQATLTASA